MTTTPILGIPLVIAQQNQPEIPHNTALMLLQAINMNVINSTTTTPPGSPSDGDAYIVAATATGAWAGREDHVAVFYGSSWYFLPGEDSAGTPIAVGAAHEGMRVYDLNLGLERIWDGSAWQNGVGLSALSTAGGVTLIGGFRATSYDLGTITTGTVTPDMFDSQYQHYVNGGAHVLGVPAGTGGVRVRISNNSSAGAVDLSNFTVSTGDTITTVDGDAFLLYINTETGGISHVHTVALQ